MAKRKFLTDFSISGDIIDQVAPPQVAGHQITSDQHASPPTRVNGTKTDSAAQHDSAHHSATAAPSNPALSTESAGSPSGEGSTGDARVHLDPDEPQTSPPSVQTRFWTEDGVSPGRASQSSFGSGTPLVWYYERAGRSYQLRSADTNSLSRRVRIRLETDDRRYFDSIDLVSSRARRGFAAEIHRVWDTEPAVIEADLSDILDRIEQADQAGAAQSQRGPSGPARATAGDLSAEEREAGLDLLRSPDIAEAIVADIEALGYVGEATNSLLVYLAATSRKLASPLSVIIVSESASGKSYLVETVRRMMPADDVVAVTSLSDQALNYIEDLRHKFLILGEAVHSEAVEHQIREMLSAKELRRLVTVKDPESGRMVSHMVSKPVVVASVMSGTSYRLNPENASRCFVIGTDESDEQTKRIHEAQRAKYTLEGIRSKREVVPRIVQRHRAAQLLLEPVAVVTPFAHALDFPAHRMRLRRDHERFLDLIASVAFLRQYQKQRKHDGALEYIEADREDYRIAYGVMVHGVLEQTLRELPRAAGRLLELIRRHVTERAAADGVEAIEVTFTQRALREALGVGHSWLKQNLRHLVEYEYVDLTSGGSARKRGFYRLVTTGVTRPADVSMIPAPETVASWAG